MTAIRTTDEAIKVARKIEEYLVTLDQANALKNADANVRRSPITDLASALAEWVAYPTNLDPEERDYAHEITKSLPSAYVLKLYYRTSAPEPFYEAIISESYTGGILASASGATEQDALRALYEGTSR